ncbi:MAG TPA: squalene/phytoene synthase family protein [Chromatiales bacterium]|nr:squalene/phytoene synthase family protein [Chromatiales bacterium]
MTAPVPRHRPDPPLSEAQHALQRHLLDGVSRTFALTIPQLPPRLAPVVANAYLLCRIVDTIEDEPNLDLEAKARHCAAFVEAVEGHVDPRVFAESLAPRLSEATLPAEHELISCTPQVLAITHVFSGAEQAALRRCVRIMAEGMVEFQRPRPHRGLEDMAELDRYCYHVAGVVGEMLTELYCIHFPQVAERRAEMMSLAVSFGQGLQMTNILKDIWDDHARGACWLPRSVFAREGVDLDRLSPAHPEPGFARALRHLVGVAHGHLANALRYTQGIPPEQTGIRNFCLWALGMAVLTLRKIYANPGFTDGRQVKISRRSVKGTILVSRATARHNALMWLSFRVAGLGLPLSRPGP